MMIYLWNKWKWTSPLAWDISHIDSPDMWGQFSTKVELKIHGVFAFRSSCFCIEIPPLFPMLVAVFLFYIQVTYDFVPSPCICIPVETMLSFLAGVDFSCSYNMLVWWWIFRVFGCVCVQKSVHNDGWSCSSGKKVKLKDTIPVPEPICTINFLRVGLESWVCGVRSVFSLNFNHNVPIENKLRGHEDHIYLHLWVCDVSDLFLISCPVLFFCLYL